MNLVMPNEKSIIMAYVLWLVGGLFGLHHFYLRRDRHAFVWWTTLGGFGVGWLGEIFRIPRYVCDANGDPKYMEPLIKKMLQNKKPPFSINRFSGMMLVGYTWGQMMMLAIPPEHIFGIDFRYLNYLVPLAVALGVWTVGNIGRERGDLKWALAAAYFAYPVRYYIYDDSLWLTAMALASALVFDSFSKQWKRTPSKRRGQLQRVAVLAACATLYAALWCGYLYFHGTLTDSDGDEVPVYEAVHHFFTSPWWLDVQQCLVDTWQYAQHHGWGEVWRQMVELSDPRGENNALKVLELDRGATQQEITARWRALSRDHHPDKAKEDRLAAQQRFMDIQRAYEILSSSKHRRSMKNKRDNSDKSKPSTIQL